VRSCGLRSTEDAIQPTQPQSTLADELLARYRAHRARVRALREPARPPRIPAWARLLAIAAALTLAQVTLAAVVWAHGPPARLVRVARVAHERVLEPVRPKQLDRTEMPKVPFLLGSVVRTDSTWECDGPVHVGLVQVTMTAAAGADRRTADAIHLRPGCTGEIGRIVVTQSAGDGIKVAEGVHDLTVYGGVVRCLAKAPRLHQDGVQVMGGARITFRNLRIDCGRADDTLVNSNLFIREGGKSLTPPTDVVCDHCSFGGGAAHTVSVQDSIRSGVTDSTLCPARYSRQMLAVGPEAVDPVTSGNRIGACGGAKAGRRVRVLTHRHS
jgi:hypothetical protein